MDEIDLSTLLTTLADPTRRKALALLRARRELCVCELMAILGVTQSRMSRHMAALKSAGLVSDRRDAQWVRYRRAPRLDKDTERIVGAVLSATKAASAMSRLREVPRAVQRQSLSP